MNESSNIQLKIIELYKTITLIIRPRGKEKQHMYYLFKLLHLNVCFPLNILRHNVDPISLNMMSGNRQKFERMSVILLLDQVLTVGHHWPRLHNFTNSTVA